jgi:hypothetical protein
MDQFGAGTHDVVEFLSLLAGWRRFVAAHRAGAPEAVTVAAYRGLAQFLASGEAAANASEGRGSARRASGTWCGTDLDRSLEVSVVGDQVLGDISENTCLEGSRLSFVTGAPQAIE